MVGVSCSGGISIQLELKLNFGVTDPLVNEADSGNVLTLATNVTGCQMLDL